MYVIPKSVLCSSIISTRLDGCRNIESNRRGLAGRICSAPVQAACTYSKKQRTKRKRTVACQGLPSSADSNQDPDKEKSRASSKTPAGEDEQPENLDRSESNAAEPQNVDWREFRARLVASDRGQQAETSTSTSTSQGPWAHDLTKPEKGCLLLAHPLMFGNSQSYFSQAVIFLFEHSDKASAGFILNKPTEHKLGKIVGADELCPEFADNLLYLGGDVGSDTMHFIHGCSDIQGAQEVVKGVFMGGFEEARYGIRSGSNKAEHFRRVAHKEERKTLFQWFNRYAGWGPGQLEAECLAGVWFPAAASSSVILNSQNLKGRDMWHTILDMMGGDYAALSQNVKAAYPEMPRDP